MTRGRFPVGASPTGATLEPFYVVGLYYADFGLTSDAEVIELLGR